MPDAITSTLVVLGATGDLAGRLLLPAVVSLRTAGALAADVGVVGTGPQDWTTREFAAHVRTRLAAHAPDVPPQVRDALAGGVRYRRADVTDVDDVRALLAFAGPGPMVVYLALPTQLMLPAVRALAACGLPPGSRVAVEKPFGVDTASARELNAALAELDDTVDVYRVDHALAMTAVQDLPRALDPATGEPIGWDARHVEQVELLWEETLALEGRAAFYDRAGALRDVVQNHLVQLLCTLAAEPPAAGGPDPGERRAAVLRAVRPLSPADAGTHTRRARYTAGRLAGDAGRRVPDYVDEDGVDPARNTETFTEVVLHVDTPRWQGTRFVLRAGKALAARRRGALVRLRSGAEPVFLDVDEPQPGHPVEAEPAAYEGVVADLLAGGNAYAVGAAEVELAWQVLTPVLDAWSAGDVPLATYPAGSPGPA